MSLTSHRAKGAIALTVAVVLAISSALYAAPRAGAVGQNEVVLSPIVDGTLLTTGCDPAKDPEDGGGSGVHTPGKDCWPKNGVVRTWDLLTVAVDYDVNEADSTATTLTVTLKPSDPKGAVLEWAPDEATGMFSGCLEGSSISADKLVLVCVVGDQKQGSHGVIRPTVRTKSGLDGTPFTVDVTMTDSSGAAPASSGPLNYWISEGPTGNWAKNPPIQTLAPITDPETGIEGYVFMFPIGLVVDTNKSNPPSGAGPLKTTSPITFNDHGWDVAEDTKLATPSQIKAAKAAGTNVNGPACGMYDAANAGAFPVTQGTWTCGEVTSPNGYPVWPITITGYSGDSPAKNADGSANTAGYAIMGQMILWMPKDKVWADFDESFSTLYHNTVSSDPAETKLAEKVEPSPIGIEGTNITIPEKTIVDNTVSIPVSRDYIGRPPGGPGNYFTHYGFFTSPRGCSAADTSACWLNRIKSNGTVQRRTAEGRPRNETADWFTGRGEVSRGERVFLNLFVGTVGSNIGREEPIQGCMKWDPTQVYLTPMGTRRVWNNKEIDGPTKPGIVTWSDKEPLNKFGDLLYGTQQGAHYRGASNTPAFVDLPQAVRDKLTIHVEYGYDTGTKSWTDKVAINATECNNTTGRVWVDGNDTAGLEKRKNADGTYGFDMVRVRIDGPFPWVTDESPGQANGQTWYNGPWGTAGFIFTMSGQIGTSLTVNPNDKRVYLHTGRSHGPWDPATQNQPSTTDCVPDPDSDDVTLQADHDPAPTNPPSKYGWCSQPYDPDAENRADPNLWTSLDVNSCKRLVRDGATDCDTDKVTIVSARPSVIKTNDAEVGGKGMDISDNGQLVKYTIDMSAIGSNYEALTKVQLVDTLPSGYTFVSLDKAPSTPGSSCTYPVPDPATGITPPGGQIVCTVSQTDPKNPTGPLPVGLAGGLWKDQIKITVLVKGAVAQADRYQPVTNRVTLVSGGLTPWDPTLGDNGGVPPNSSGPFDAEQADRSGAASYLPFAHDEAAIIKAVNKELGPCTAMPDGTALTGEALAAWKERCSMIALDPDPSNGNVTDTVGNMTFKLTYKNTGNSKLTNVRLVDVLPFIGDGKGEPPSNSAADGAKPSTVGDARTPGSEFKGKLGLVSVSGATETWVTKTDPTKVSRDPDAAINQAAWCKATEADPDKYEQVAGPTGDCPANMFEVTAIYVVMPDILPDYDASISVTLDTEGADCNNLWTNTYGLRAAEIKLPVRSNDVSVMAGCQSVGDFTWLDTNRNGLQDNGEPALPGITVNLYDEAGKQIATTKTDTQGYYSFQKLAPSTTYTIEFVKQGDATFTKQNASGDTSNTASDNTDPPLAGTQAAAKTHGDSDADPETGKVTFTTSATIGANKVSNVTEGTVADNPGIDAGFVTPPVSIGDYVWIDVNRDGQQDVGEPAVPGVTVNLYAADGKTLLATTKTDTNGYYAFANLFGGLDYVVEFVKPTGATFTIQNAGSDVTDSDADPKTGRVNVTAPLKGNNETAPGKADDPTFDAGFVQLNLVLLKKITTAAPYTPGQTVTFELTPSNDGPADALPGWSVTDLLPVGLTYVSASGAGYTCEPGKDDVGDTVTCTAANGLVAGATGAPILVQAKIDGYFVGQLHNVAYVSPDSKEIPETNPLVIPKRETDTDSTSTDNDAQAVLAVNPVSIGDYVWWDTNRDGLQQDTESPIPGIVVTLYLPDGTTQVATTTTDENGFYSFTDLAPGSDYVIVFTNPDGTFFTLQTAGDDRSIDSNPDATGFAKVRTPNDGKNSATEPDDPTYDAGLIQLNLTLVKERTGPEQVAQGNTVTFNLIPHNDGPVDALAGWSVTDLLPSELAFVSASGDGYTCTSSADAAGTYVTCVAAAPLLAGVDGPTITLVTRVAASQPAPIHNVAFVSPDSKDIPETNPLVRPNRDTDTDTTPTDNDSQADLTLGGALVETGGPLAKFAVPLGVLLMLVSAGVLILGRRRPTMVV